MTHRLLLALALLAPLSSLAQKDDDAPIPYDDDGDKPAVKPKRPSRPRDQVREEEEDARAADETLTHLDDPNVGLSVEGLAGAMLFESSRGALVDARFMGGARFTWEYGRLIPDEYLREVFFADVTWQYAATKDGTTQVNSETHAHYFTVSPGFALPFGKSPVAAYAQVGAGFNYTFTAVHIEGNETQLSGTKFLFQYGLGLRFRPAVVASGAVRISFRIEFTRFLRGYLNDTFIGGSVGVTF
jgi:hypothetical protein